MHRKVERKYSCHLCQCTLNLSARQIAQWFIERLLPHTIRQEHCPSWILQQNELMTKFTSVMTVLCENICPNGLDLVLCSYPCKTNSQACCSVWFSIKHWGVHEGSPFVSHLRNHNEKNWAAGALKWLGRTERHLGLSELMDLPPYFSKWLTVRVYCFQIQSG